MAKSKKKKNTKNSVSKLKNKKLIVYAIIAMFAYFLYILFAPNLFPGSNEKKYLLIPEGSTYDNVLDSLRKEGNILNVYSFKQASQVLRYGNNIRSGRYELHNGMNNFTLIRKLRSGRQTPLKLTFNNIRTKEQLAARLGKQLMADSASIIGLLNDTAFLSAYHLNPETSVSLFIPNTYEVFWNINAQQLFERMNKEYGKFWNEERTQKANAIPLSKAEVATLASIVEEETNNKKDRPMVAGLYINRLKTGMPLQADPTVKFALGDFSIKRILFGHLQVNSPYNTYKFTGLPPGPIRVATPAGIDAVLNYAHHNYIYMCASETLNGEHKFAVTWQEHLVNARKYRKEMDEMHIH
ncbi:MAG TPA: endolytic transglycosylase MltG [Paludibacter sp.]|nr:endolytic transglycosylase MltG [Paludibacter sp.]